MPNGNHKHLISEEREVKNLSIQPIFLRDLIAECSAAPKREFRNQLPLFSLDSSRSAVPVVSVSPTFRGKPPAATARSHRRWLASWSQDLIETWHTALWRRKDISLRNPQPRAHDGRIPQHEDDDDPHRQHVLHVTVTTRRENASPRPCPPRRGSSSIPTHASS